jgi:hypothetical protein
MWQVQVQTGFVWNRKNAAPILALACWPLTAARDINATTARVESFPVSHRVRQSSRRSMFAATRPTLAVKKAVVPVFAT